MMVTKVKNNNRINEKEKGSISLFVLVACLFFLMIVVGISIYTRNKTIAIDKEEKRIKSSYEKDIENIDSIYERKIKYSLPKNKGTRPYFPSEDFSKLEGTDLKTGLVIQDKEGNQFVWIEVPNDGTGPDYSTVTGSTDYTNIENALHTYTNTYRNGTTFKDEYYSDATTVLTQTKYYELKNKMLKSIYENGGFYVGRYETGIEISDEFRAYGTDSFTEHPITQKPVIKANAYPYNWVRCSQTQQLAEQFKPSGEKYESSLMFGVQWDLVMKYLETKGVIQDELKSDSVNWGNYSDKTYNIQDINVKYSRDAGAIWTSTPYNKISSSSILLTTGASDEFKKQNIYDVAGNVWEWTLEYTSDISNPCALRGGCYIDKSSVYPASYRLNRITTLSISTVGFRVSLY